MDVSPESLTTESLLLNDSVVFTDGACSKNPGPGGWGVILAIQNSQVIELGGHTSQTTNNRMEMRAALEALHWIDRANLASTGKIFVCTDSKYLIQGITRWFSQWEKNGWVTRSGEPVKNARVWPKIKEIVLKLESKGYQVFWRHVKGHSGIITNERVDEIAVSFSKHLSPALYSGPIASYSTPILKDFKSSKTVGLPKKEKVREETEENLQVSTKKSTVNAKYYLSYVNGHVTRHKTWPECERSVKGVSGARFKKVSSLEEETKTLKEWGAF